ncbi:hypothetical protein ONS95_009466 [Cadophora gregata]|uniref:uncharacterized protein n=1 Tax=Cadophora gregata TaxID=51156 RepID=UPI0026DA9A36|nr:uncharacterized protein ONS95_009466 [Cadophora gregata]KAK0124517.1 hypothetical protein ONS95_009466 [Cadophora gregata]KAK0129631.1 hypothetical protein ONS96_000195 [Cadophora gregata f. sp. sojae]
MGEFHGAVSSLLDAFARGIGIIKAQRKRRKNGHIPIDQSSKTAETQLSKSLKKSRTEVKNAYGKDLNRYGPGFAEGDAEARSSLQAIMFRLNAGFVSVIERFTKGRSSPTDYQVLLNLSNSSRLEAITTFQQLSYRLSRSSLALPLSPHRTGHKASATHRRKQKSVTSSLGHSKRPHTRSKSAPELSISSTPLGPATPEGWIRPKASRKSSTDSRSSGSSTPKQRSSPKPLALPAPPAIPRPASATRRSPPPPPYQSQLSSPSSIPEAFIPDLSPPPVQRLQVRVSKADKRKSFMSFASDSTKLGEIPEHRWGRNAIPQGGQFPITPYYPVQMYQEPQKPRSRFMRLFRR